MPPKCNSCGFHHGREFAGLERCRNARDLGMKLNARLNVTGVPRACESFRHEQYKQSGDAFLLNTVGWSLVDDGVEVFIHGTCRRCLGSLSYPVRASDQKAVSR